MNKYNVRIEIATQSTDFATITVEADSPEQARKLAADVYHSDDCPDLDYWASDYLESKLDTEYQDDWQVDKQ